MKKILWSLACGLAMLLVASCTNDDIDIIVSKEVTIKVMPETVIEGLDPGALVDLNTLKTYSLRVRSLVYDKEGELVTLQQQFTDSYSKVVTFNPVIPVGDYTVISVVDVVRLNASKSAPSFYFWQLSDSTMLSRVKVKDAGYVGNSRKILGACNQKMTVTRSGASITAKPECQGSVVINMYWDYSGRYNGTYNPEVEDFRTISKKSCDYLMPTDNETFDYSFQTKSWYYIAATTPVTMSETYNGKNNNYNYAETYSFLFPSDNVPITLSVKRKNQKSFDDWSNSPEMGTFKKGKQYVFYVAYWGDRDGDGSLRANIYLGDYNEDNNVRTRAAVASPENLVKLTPAKANGNCANFESGQELKLADI